ncbi:hypothetical protein INR49_029796 [Caranx melampygus]|nr:hypothetical protein INR49_029796 [Caranx melampygus]
MTDIQDLQEGSWRRERSGLGVVSFFILCREGSEREKRALVNKKDLSIREFPTSEKVPGVFQIIQIIPRGMQTIEDMAMNQPIPPRKMSIIKKRQAQSGDRGIIVTALGFGHSFDGNILFVGHEAQHREDGETCNEAGAAVQTTQHDAVPEREDRGQEKWITLNQNEIMRLLTPGGERSPQQSNHTCPHRNKKMTVKISVRVWMQETGHVKSDYDIIACLRSSVHSQPRAAQW